MPIGCIHVVVPFQSDPQGNYAFVNTADSMGRRQMENSRCFNSAYGGKKHILKTTLPQKNSPRIKTPYPYLMNLVSIYLEKNILSNTAKINGIQSRMSLKLRIKIDCILFGPPCIWSLRFSSLPCSQSNCNLVWWESFWWIMVHHCVVIRSLIGQMSMNLPFLVGQCAFSEQVRQHFILYGLI